MKKGKFASKFIGTVLAFLMIGATLGGIGLAQDALPGGGASAASVSYPFSDDLEVAGNWLADLPSKMTTADYHSATTSWTDSEGDFYGNNINVSLTLASPINLSSATNPQLKFWHHFQMEAGFDYGYVEISTDGGTNWTTLASYSGTTSSPYQGPKLSSVKGVSTQEVSASATEPWVMEQIDLSAYAGQANVKVRFRLETDASVVRDGWYIDDISILDSPYSTWLADRVLW